MAAQLKRTSGLSLRLDRVCRRLLNSSLPVPVSPRTSTVTSLSASRTAVSIARFSTGLEPTMRTPDDSSRLFCRARSRRSRVSSARWMP
jgi:hypothetical protein